jgi:hypothetical protein
LIDLYARITNALPEGSVERQNSVITLSNIRCVLMRHDQAP